MDVRTVSCYLTSGESLVKGKRTPMTTFTSQDIIRFYAAVQWNDVTKQYGVHYVTYNWYSGTNLVSSARAVVNFSATPTELWTQRSASALGVGHYKAEILIQKQVIASKEFDITQ